MTAARLLVALGEALHVCGSPAHRTEDALGACARRFGLEAQFFSTPTSMFLAIGPRDTAHALLLRVEPGEVNLDKLGRLYGILDEILDGKLDVDAATQRITEAMATPPPYGATTTLIAHAFACAAAAVFLSGGVYELTAAALVGGSIGAFDLLTRRYGAMQRAYQPIACFLAVTIVHALAAAGLPLSVRIASLASLIVLLPGMAVTTGIVELATKHLSSGTSRLMGAFVILLTMAVGVGVGDHTAELLFGVAPNVIPVELPGVFRWLAAVGFAFTAAVLLRVGPRDLPWVVAGVLLALLGATLGAPAFGRELSAFFGAFLVATFSNAFAHLRRRPAAIVSTPGLLILVPGSIGFRGLTSVLAKDVLPGVELVFGMLLIASSLAAGVLFANVVLPPRRENV